MARVNRYKAAAVAARRAAALDYKIAGVDNLTIGLRLHADRLAGEEAKAAVTGATYQRPAWAEAAYTQHGKALANAVSTDLSRAIHERRHGVEQRAQALVDLNYARLERLLAACWARALQGDDKAMLSALRIMQRQARLLGLDAATRVKVEGTLDAEAKALVDGLLALADGETRDLDELLGPAPAAGPDQDPGDGDSDDDGDDE